MIVGEQRPVVAVHAAGLANEQYESGAFIGREAVVRSVGTPGELRALLRQAGFESPRRLATRIPVAAQVLVSTLSRNEL